MTNPTDSKALNAIRLHLILLNEGSDAVHFRLVEIIKQRDLTNPNCVKDFLIDNYNANQPNPRSYLNGFMKTIREKFNNVTNQFPNHLNDFDITAYYPIAYNFLSLRGVELEPFNSYG